MDLAHLTQLAVKAARRAGHIIRTIYLAQEQLPPQLKADLTPLTLADLAAHESLSTDLMRDTPEIPLLSEEGELVEISTRQKWHVYWCADPLDGTKEFLARTGDFSVNLALIVRGVPILGVIYSPMNDHMYFSFQNDGAWLQVGEENNPEKIHTSQAQKPFRALASRHFNHTKLSLILQKWIEDKNQVQPLLHIGSASKFALVAQGEADIYLRLSPTMQWDTAAGDCILREAGGITCQLNGAPLHYSPLGPFENPHFIALGDSSILPELLQILS